MRRNPIVELTGRLPLPARSTVKDSYLRGRDAARQGNGEDRQNQVNFLRRFAWAHMPNVIYGVGTATAAAAMDGPLPLRIANVAYAGLFAGTDMLAIYTQLNLAGRLSKMEVAAPPPQTAQAVSPEATMHADVPTHDTNDTPLSKPELTMANNLDYKVGITRLCGALALLPSVVTQGFLGGNLSIFDHH